MHFGCEFFASYPACILSFGLIRLFSFTDSGNKNEMEISFSPDEQIKQYASIKNCVYQAVDSSKIMAFATVEIIFEFPDGSRDEQSIILQMEFEYDANASVWTISDIQSSVVKLQKFGR